LEESLIDQSVEKVIDQLTNKLEVLIDQNKVINEQNKVINEFQRSHN
jgi:hypothetical protein